jgi:hypothetical protein
MNLPPLKHSALFRIIIGLVSASVVSSAKDLYVAQSAQGSGNGSSATNAYAVSFFNSSSNWGAGTSKISPGDTVHLVGTIGTQLVIGGSGTDGSPITILFEPGSKLSAPYWGVGSAAAIYSYGRSFITIDGNSVGVIENTANGTTLANKQMSWGISLDTGTNITVKRLTIQNIYVRTALSNDYTGSSGVGIRAINATGVSNLVFDSNSINYAKFGIIADMSGMNNVTVTNNTIARCSTMVAITKADAAPSTGTIVAGNIFLNGNYWDYTSGDVFHNDGLHMWTATGPFVDVSIYRNQMLTDWGNHTTGLLFLEGAYQTLYIYDNLLGTTTGKIAEAPIDIQAAYSGGTTAYIYNNTLVGAGTDNTGGMGLYMQGAQWTKVAVKNNIFYNFYAAVTLLTTQSVAALDFDYNNYFSVGNVCTRINPTSGDQSGSSWDISTWQSYIGSSDETHSKMLDPQFVSKSDFSLKSSSPLLTAGLPLSGIYVADLLGLSRSGSGWALGAYQSGSGGSVVIPSNATISISMAP